MNHRHSIRLQDFDYRQAGHYFVTVCIQDRRCMLGSVIDGKMHLNDAGKMVQYVWNELPNHYPGIETDSFIVMPNHIHGIIVLCGCESVGAGPCARPFDNGQARLNITGQARLNITGQARGPAPTLSLPDVVHRYKTLTTKHYTDGVKKCGWVAYNGRFWQRNYYEHVIRNEFELDRIRRYINDNPNKWEHDRDHGDESWRE